MRADVFLSMSVLCLSVPSTKTSLAFKDSDCLRWELMYFCLVSVFVCHSALLTILTSLAFRDSDCIRWELMYFCVCVCFCLCVTVPSTRTNLAFRDSHCIKWELMHVCLCQFLSGVGRCVSFSLVFDSVSVFSFWRWTLCISFWVAFSLVLDALCLFLGLFLVLDSASVSGSVSLWCWVLWVRFSLVLDSASVSLGLSFSRSVSVSLYQCLTSPTHLPQSIHRKPRN